MVLLGFAAFVIFGAVLVLLGASQAELARELGLDLGQTGLLAGALSLGLGFGVVGAGPWIDRTPRRPIFWLALAVAGAALLSFRPGISFPEALLGALALGVGIGIYDTLVSALVAERYGADSARPMTLVHSGATLGAVGGPLLIGWLAQHFHWSAGFRALAVAHAALALVLLWVPLPPPPGDSAGGVSREVWSPALLPFAAIAFAYVGLETSLTVFAQPYAAEGLGLAPGRGLRAISAFWLGLFAGRIGLVVLPGAGNPRWLVAAGASGAALLAGGVLLGLPQLELHLGATGLALGFVFPLMVALTGQRFPRARGTALGLAIGAGALGGAAVPWLHGWLGDRLGVATAVGALAFWLLAVAAAAAVCRR